VTNHLVASGSGNMTVSQSSAAPVTALHKHAKYKKALTLAKQLAEECSVMGIGEFQEHCKVLEHMLSLWRAGRNVTVTDISQLVEDETVTDLMTQHQTTDLDIEASDVLPAHDDGTAALLESTVTDNTLHDRTETTTQTITDLLILHQTTGSDTEAGDVLTAPEDSTDTGINAQMQTIKDAGSKISRPYCNAWLPERSAYNSDRTETKEKC